MLFLVPSSEDKKMALSRVKCQRSDRYAKQSGDRNIAVQGELSALWPQYLPWRFLATTVTANAIVARNIGKIQVLFN
jgi:hypothetical protein